MAHPLAGKVVIITGASSGIGAAAARELARAGCKVALAARSGEKLQQLSREIGEAALAQPTDVTSGEEVRRLVAVTLERFGGIDVLFANAGVYVPGQFAEGGQDALAALIDVNVNGVLRCIHAVLPHMKARGRGDILVTSSISGHVDIPWSRSTARRSTRCRPSFIPCAGGSSQRTASESGRLRPAWWQTSSGG